MSPQPEHEPTTTSPAPSPQVESLPSTGTDSPRSLGDIKGGWMSGEELTLLFGLVNEPASGWPEPYKRWVNRLYGHIVALEQANDELTHTRTQEEFDRFMRLKTLEIREGKFTADLQSSFLLPVAAAMHQIFKSSGAPNMLLVSMHTQDQDGAYDLILKPASATSPERLAVERLAFMKEQANFLRWRSVESELPLLGQARNETMRLGMRGSLARTARKSDYVEIFTRQGEVFRASLWWQSEAPSVLRWFRKAHIDSERGPEVDGVTHFRLCHDWPQWEEREGEQAQPTIEEESPRKAGVKPSGALWKDLNSLMSFGTEEGTAKSHP
jgi:hypothetical protein